MEALCPGFAQQCYRLPFFAPLLSQRRLPTRPPCRAPSRILARRRERRAHHRYQRDDWPHARSRQRFHGALYCSPVFPSPGAYTVSITKDGFAAAQTTHVATPARKPRHRCARAEGRRRDIRCHCRGSSHGSPHRPAAARHQPHCGADAADSAAYAPHYRVCLCSIPPTARRSIRATSS